MSARIVELRQGILKKNDQLAGELRTRLREAGVFTFNVVSSPGTGKTELLRHTLERLRLRGHRVAALVGDLETENDARRLAAAGVPVRQILTHGLCHLEASMIESHLTDWDLTDLDVLCIENVGNLVCPSSYDLGEERRAVFLSVTEGEDKPLKYPKLFNSADVAVVTKMDLAEACDFDAALAEANIHAIRPGLPVFWTSAKTGDGVDVWVDYLDAALAQLRAEPVV